MPSTVYTQLLWEINNAGPTFPEFGPSVPTGFVWVVRDVLAYFPSTAGALSVTPQLWLATDGCQIFATPPFETLANTLYSVRDLRTTMMAGAAFELQAGASGWNVRVTGYQLTA